MRRGAIVGVVVGTVLLAALIAVVLFLALQAKKNKQNTLGGVDAAEIRNFVKESFNSVIRLLSTTNLPLPDIYTGCSGSTINRLKFCGNLKYSGTVEIGGSVACSIPYNACRAACTTACIPCRIIPFVSCKVPCTDCPNACKRVYDACSGATKAEWSVNVLEVFDLGNTFRIAEFDTFSVDTTSDGATIKLNAVVMASPKANVDIRTTASLGNYQGAVGLGNLRIVIPMELQYSCTTKQTTLVKLDRLQVDGVNVRFDFGSLSDVIKNAIYNIAKSKIDDTIKDKLQDKLTELFKDFIQSELLPRLQLNITC